MKIAQLNCQGLLAKMEDLHQMFLYDWKSDVICLSETWLRPSSTVDSFLALHDFALFRRDRPGRSHGGLLVYVRDHIRARRRPDLEHSDLECISLQLSL